MEATYEGDLLAASSISWTRGRESSATYNESLAGIRAETPYRQIDVDIDPYITPNDSSSGLLYGISSEPFGTPGDGDLHLQAYSYRLPLTDNPNNSVPLTKPEGYDPSEFELHRRFAKAGGEFYLPSKRLPGGKTDLIGSEGALSTDLLGMNDEWPVAGYEGREKIMEATKRFTKGFMWFLATDESVPVSQASSARFIMLMLNARKPYAKSGLDSATAATSSQTTITSLVSSTCAMRGG